jgi:predicted nucleotidyltransferase
MAESTTSVTKSLQRFIELLKRRLHHIEAVYLYGSQAQGLATAWSDIDVAVVSPAFASDLFQARVMLLRLAAQVMLLRLAAQVDDRIEPATFTPQDFVPSDPLVSEIQRTGVRLV